MSCLGLAKPRLEKLHSVQDILLSTYAQSVNQTICAIGFLYVKMHYSSLTRASSAALPTAYATKGIAVHKVDDGLDLVGAQVLDELERVNALNVERLPIRQVAV